MRVLTDIDVLGDAAFQARMTALSLAVLVATALAAALLAAAPGAERPGVWWWAALVAGSALALPVHELVHAAAFRLLCPGCRVSFGCRGAFLYTRAEGALMARRRMVAVLLSPTVLVSAALAAAALCAGLPVLAALLVGIHLSGCAGDILMAATVLRERSCTHALDTETGMTLLCDREEAVP